MTEPKRHYYLTDYSDEVMPCSPTLEAWAEWLAVPDPTWPHDIPANGAEFAVSTIDELDCLTATKVDGVWSLDRAPPADATAFVVRHGRSGWDVETFGDEPLDYLNDHAHEYDEGDTEEIVCTRRGPALIVRFDSTGPRLVIIGEAQ